MRITKTIKTSEDEIDTARKNAVSLIHDFELKDSVVSLFYSNDLRELESGIIRLNRFAQESWLLSSLLLYSVVYDKEKYRQSGLSWNEYLHESRERLGIEQSAITYQLSAARFFIKHCNKIMESGWNPHGSARKLAMAELAYSLCGDLDETIRHMAKDSWAQFYKWYSSFKEKKPKEILEADIKGSKFYVGGKEAVTISDEIPDKDRRIIKDYLKQIFSIMQHGKEPVITPK